MYGCSSVKMLTGHVKKCVVLKDKNIEGFPSLHKELEDRLGCFVNYVSYIMYKAATEKISSLRESTSPSFSLLRPQQVLRDQDQPRELIA